MLTTGQHQGARSDRGAHTPHKNTLTDTHTQHTYAQTHTQHAYTDRHTPHVHTLKTHAQTPGTHTLTDTQPGRQIHAVC